MRTYIQFKHYTNKLDGRIIKHTKYLLHYLFKNESN